MASSFSFPLMKPAQIVEALHSYGLAPRAKLCVEDIVNPQPVFVAEVLDLFLVNVIGDEPDEQLQSQGLQVLDNPEHHMRAIAFMRIY